jgi:tetratricopeptide (TPR) repeat protein
MEVMLGNPDEALRIMRRALELTPESMDAAEGARHAVSRAWVYAWMGDQDRALAEFARLLRQPGVVTVSLLRQSLRWNTPLRGDPRFEALLNDPKNNAPLF